MILLYINKYNSMKKLCIQNTSNILWKPLENIFLSTTQANILRFVYNFMKYFPSNMKFKNICT